SPSATSPRSPTRKSSRIPTRRIHPGHEHVTEDYRKTVLPNGIRVITERMPHVRSVAVGVWVETGSRHEVEGRGGMSHLIEPLVFKGTATRSAAAIASEMDSVGGEMAGFPSKDAACVCG